MMTVEKITAAIEQKPIQAAYDIVRHLGGGWLPCEYERMIRACAYQAIENKLGTAAMDTLMDEVSPGWRD